MIKRFIVLTSKDLHPSKIKSLESPFYNINLFNDFKHSSINRTQVFQADIIIFSSGKDIIELKNRHK